MAARTSSAEQLIANVGAFSETAAIEQSAPEEAASGSGGECLVKCANCDEIFSPEHFEEHVCEFDEQKRRIEPGAAGSSWALDGHPCFRQIEENMAQWRKLTKRKGSRGTDNGGDKKKSTTSRGDGRKESHKCPHCEREFVHASGLLKHVANRHPEMPIGKIHEQKAKQPPPEPFKVCLKCLPCGMIFATMDKMMEHLEKTDWEEELERTDGIYMSEGKFQLRKAIRIVILTTVYQCEFCDKLFSDLPALFRHESLHDPLFGYECCMCEIKIPTVKDILFHRLNECVFRQELIEQFAGLSRYFACNVCEQQFESLVALNEHRFENFHLSPRLSRVDDEPDASQVLRIGCDQCTTIFDNADQHISHHTDVHHPKRSSTQGRRQTVQKSSSNTTNNASTTPSATTNSPSEYSSTTRPYLCELCGKTYTQSSHLWQHLRFHNGIRPFVCPEEGCKRSFTIRPDLKDHIRKCHTGERPYHCTQCDKRFLTGSVYYQHRLIHRGERRYGCEECGKRFYRADALKNHQRIHSGEKPYACLHCGKSFRQRGDREKHIRVRHSHFPEATRDENVGWTTPVTSRGGSGGAKRTGGKRKEPKAKRGGRQRQQPPEKQVEMGDGERARVDQLLEHSGMVDVADLSLPASLFQPILNDIDML